jgi:hypothetical protein
MLITNLTDVDYWFGPMHLAAGSGQTLTLDDTSDTSLYLLNDEVADAVNTLYLSSYITVSSQALPFPRPTGVPALLHGDGSPQGMVYAPQGSLYMRRDSVAPGTSLYTKTTGVTLNTGWSSVIEPPIQLINSQTLSAAAPEITFGSIPPSYTHLKIIASLGCNDSEANLNMTVNGSDDINAYCTNTIYTLGGFSPTVAAAWNPNSAAAYLGGVPESGFGGTEITLMNYLSATMVPFSVTNSWWQETGEGGSGSYLGTGMIVTSGAIGGAITSITLAPDTGDLSIGSVASLYGLNG